MFAVCTPLQYVFEHSTTLHESRFPRNTNYTCRIHAWKENDSHKIHLLEKYSQLQLPNIVAWFVASKTKYIQPQFTAAIFRQILVCLVCMKNMTGRGSQYELMSNTPAQSIEDGSLLIYLPEKIRLKAIKPRLACVCIV